MPQFRIDHLLVDKCKTQKKKHHLRRDDALEKPLFLKVFFGFGTQWSRLGSNQRPLPCRGSALPAELRNRELNCVSAYCTFIIIAGL